MVKPMGEQIRIGIVGGGVCGGILAALLKRKSAAHIGSIRIWEKDRMEDLREGFNLQLDHNVLAALSTADPELTAAITSIGVNFKKRTHRAMDGSFLMDIDVSELATREFGSIVRWDTCVRLIRSFSDIEYGKVISGYFYRGDEVVVNFADGETAVVDLLIVANGRYSKLRGPTEHDLSPGLMNFRYKFKVTPEEAALVETHERIYHFPDKSRLEQGGELEHLGRGSLFQTVCMEGMARIGVLPLRNNNGVVDQLYFYGNFKLCPDGECPPEAKTRDGLRALFQPKDGTSVDALAQLCIDQMLSNVEKLDWARCQTSPANYTDESGRVLFLGDAASGFFPMLTQGSGQAIEDSVTTCAVLLSTYERHQVPAATKLVQETREARRKHIMALSKEHAQHMVEGGQEALDAFTGIWTGADGGKGREHLKEILSGYPKFSECHVLAKTRLM